MTMFNQLDIQGFKSFEYASLSLHPLTILTGLNSSGKSTVIQAIRMLARDIAISKAFVLSKIPYS